MTTEVHGKRFRRAAVVSHLRRMAIEHPDLPKEELISRACDAMLKRFHSDMSPGEVRAMYGRMVPNPLKYAGMPPEGITLRYSEESERKKRQIEKLRAAQTGKTYSAETREKVRRARLGTKHSEYTKRKIGQSTRGWWTGLSEQEQQAHASDLSRSHDAWWEGLDGAQRQRHIDKLKADYEKWRAGMSEGDRKAFAKKCGLWWNRLSDEEKRNFKENARIRMAIVKETIGLHLREKGAPIVTRARDSDRRYVDIAVNNTVYPLDFQYFVLREAVGTLPSNQRQAVEYAFGLNGREQRYNRFDLTAAVESLKRNKRLCDVLG